MGLLAWVTSEVIFQANHLTDIDKTKHNYDQQHKNLNNRTRKLLTYEQTEPHETKDWFMGLLCNTARNQTYSTAPEGGE